MGEKCWICAADRLPPDSEEVWAYDIDEGVIAATHDRFGWNHVYGDGDGLGDSRLYQVTHWMPMDKPNPPPPLLVLGPSEIKRGTVAEVHIYHDGVCAFHRDRFCDCEPDIKFVPPTALFRVRGGRTRRIQNGT